MYVMPVEGGKDVAINLTVFLLIVRNGFGGGVAVVLLLVVGDDFAAVGT